ncbi:MAG TPA: hypothetical protein VL443_08280 [Cyclobacteriaceae bacterium]|jgi:hypothetical protein|nr:hypothetical protein [Cyclobacteriaceae bacterium]
MTITTGGTETSATTTFSSTSSQYGEILPRGGTGTPFASLPAPTGKGWIFWPGAGTYATGNWSASITLSSAIKGINTVVRFFKYSGGVYTAIGSITATTTTTAKTTYSYAPTAMSSVTLGANDGIYVDLFWFDSNSNITNDNPVIYTASSSTAGVINDVQITTSTFSGGGGGPPPFAIIKIQSNETNSTTTVTSQTITLPSGISQNNLVVASIAVGSNNTTVTGPTGWTQVRVNQPAGASATIQTSIWYLVVGAGQAGQTSWTWTLNASHSAYACIEEWNATHGWPTNPVDQSAIGDTAATPITSTTITSGTTATTVQANELWIASLAYKNSAQTENAVTTGWTSDLESTLAANNTMTMLSRVTTSIGTASCQYTISSAQFWAGCVVTFMPIVAITNSRSITASSALLSTNTRAISGAAALQSTNNKSIALSAALLATTARNITAKASIGNTFNRSISTTAIFSQPVDRSVPATAALLGTRERDIQSVAALLRTQINRSISSIAALLLTRNQSIPANVALSSTNLRNVPTTGALLSKLSKVIPANASLTFHSEHFIGANAALLSTISRAIPVTASLSIEILSGGFALSANGTGTASFDSFRVTKYPDPSMNLSTVTPRVGATSISYNALVPSNTTLGVDISLDGVNWTDVTNNSGESIPGIFSQPNPTFDGFDTITSDNYIQTFKTGGSDAVWSYDTNYSRLIATGGSDAVYVYQEIFHDDIDMSSDLDRADSGGIIWRYIDNSNFYYLLVSDTLTSNGTKNTATVYKVSGNTKTSLGSEVIAYDVGTSTGSSYTVKFTRGTFRRFRVIMADDTITVFVDDNQLFSCVDSAPLSSGYMGLYTNGGDTGSRFYQLRMTPLGDNVAGTPSGDIVTSQFVYTRLRLATTDPTETPQVEDITVNALSPSIGIGVSIPAVTYNATFVSANFDDLAKQSNYSWYFNSETKETIFRASDSVVSPWILQSAPDGLVPSVDLEITSNFELDVENDLYRNRQIILGALETGAFFETQKGDGNTRTFTLGYPLAGTPIIILNGTENTSVGLKGMTGFDFYYALNDPVIVQDSSLQALEDGDQLEIFYSGYFEVTVIVDNEVEQNSRAAIEGGTGIVEAVEDHSGENMTREAAVTLANQLLERYAIAGRTLIFDTTRNGLALGQNLTIFLPEHGIWDGQFEITQIEITLKKGLNDTQVWWYKVTASELPKLSSWAKLVASGLLLK